MNFNRRLGPCILVSLAVAITACSDEKPKIKFVDQSKENHAATEEPVAKPEHTPETTQENAHAFAETELAAVIEEPTDAAETHTTPESHEPAHAHAVHWSYTGEGAPHAWGALKDEFALCETGKSQSPIDVSTVTVTGLPSIEINYQPSAIHLVNNGHTIKLDYDKGSSITVDGKTYNLLQFHFHSPSEHTIGGKAYDMVAHLVHQADDGQLGVIGVVMKVGQENKLLSRFWEHLPQETDGSFEDNSANIQIAELLPPDMTYFNYSGSLTTPPCSEGVNWMLLATPAQVSQAQIDRFTTLFPTSVRPVQPLNGRVVKLSN